MRHPTLVKGILPLAPCPRGSRGRSYEPWGICISWSIVWIPKEEKEKSLNISFPGGQTGVVRGKEGTDVQGVLHSLVPGIVSVLGNTGTSLLDHPR